MFTVVISNICVFLIILSVFTEQVTWILCNSTTFYTRCYQSGHM